MMALLKKRFRNSSRTVEGRTMVSGDSPATASLSSWGRNHPGVMALSAHLRDLEGRGQRPSRSGRGR